MTLPVEVNPLLLGNRYPIQRSLRFRASASAYLSRTPSVAGNQTTWTWSGWVKRGALGINGCLFAAYTSGSTYYVLQIASNDTLQHYNQTGGSITAYLNSPQVFRDPSSWYHIVAIYNSTDATSSNRMSLYVNGVKITVFATATYPTQNTVATVNSTSAHYISQYGLGNYFDGYLAEVNFIDGFAYDPTYFGQYNEFGVWSARKYGGSYGTNGFYLPFNDPTSATTLCYDRQLGYTDTSKNNWTPNNISVTAGPTYDAMTDVPPPSTIQNVAAGNYATLNPLTRLLSGYTLAAGNLDITNPTAGSVGCSGTFSVSSNKWYYEATAGSVPNGTYVGVGSSEQSNRYLYLQTGNKYSDAGGSVAYGASFTTGDIIGVAFDLDNGTVVFYKNGASQGTAFTGLSGSFFPVWVTNGTVSTSWSFNFGQRPFSYTPPSGFLPLNSNNLPMPTIPNGAKVMAATTYTGTGSNPRAIAISSTNSGNNPLGTTFQPDFVWVKARNTTFRNRLQNSVVGANKLLISDLADAEYTNETNGYLTSFNADGFTVTTGATSDDGVNNLNDTYIAWQWNAGGAPTPNNNTDGSITSTVSVNKSAGFSVVTYTGTGANATVGHGLGVAPSFIIFKNRSSVLNWIVYTATTGAGNVLFLDATNGSTANTTAFNNTSPTSSVFSVGAYNNTNQNTNNLVAYCWTPIAGYSAMGGFTGNGSTDGVYVYTGFRPRYLLFKITSAGGGSWQVKDTSRDLYNVSTATLYPNLANAEASDTALDLLSNGFKLRVATGENASGTTVTYLAFAENPFKLALAR